jgi:hypothetical protein
VVDTASLRRVRVFVAVKSWRSPFVHPLLFCPPRVPPPPLPTISQQKITSRPGPSSLAGYASARFSKFFREENQFKTTVLVPPTPPRPVPDRTSQTATLVPGTIFFIFFLLNLLIWSKGSSGAVPFGTMVAIVVLWFGISVPLVMFGSYLGYKKEVVGGGCWFHLF